MFSQFGGGRTHREIKCYFYHIKDTSYQPDVVDVDLDHLAEVVFFRFLYHKVTFYLALFYSVYFGRKSLCTAQLGSYTHQLFGFFCRGELSFSLFMN
jgi:hypothetical protein